MRKYKNINDLKRRWNDKIESQKFYYEILERTGRVSGGWENSDIAKSLKRKKDRAIYRYENYDTIAPQRRERYRVHAEMRERFEAGEIGATFEGSAIDAFRGGRGIADNDFVKSVNPENFAAHLVVNDEGGNVIDKWYYDRVAYFSELAKWIHSLYDKKLGYKIFNSTVNKTQFYDKQQKTLYFEHKININNEDEE